MRKEKRGGGGVGRSLCRRDQNGGFTHFGRRSIINRENWGGSLTDQFTLSAVIRHHSSLIDPFLNTHSLTRHTVIKSGRTRYIHSKSCLSQRWGYLFHFHHLRRRERWRREREMEGHISMANWTIGSSLYAFVWLSQWEKGRIVSEKQTFC